MKPLSPLTFLVRNPGKTLPLVGVIIMAVILIQSVITLINSIPLSIRTIYGYSAGFLGVSPRLDPSATPRYVEMLTKKTPVPIGKVSICRASPTQVKSIVGKWPFAVLALDTPDIQYYFERQQMGELTGRLPNRGAAEMVVSELVARNLGAKIGTVLLSPEDSNSFMYEPVKVVGIVKGDKWLMVADRAFYERVQPIKLDLAVIYTKDPKDQPAYDRWATAKLKGESAQLFAFHEIEEQASEMFAVLYQVLNVVIGILVLVITAMMAMLMNIYQNQRMTEFGLLQAIGYTRRQLILRVVAEAVIVVVVGWILGVALSLGLLSILKAKLMDPRAFALNIFDPMALLYTGPVPVAIFLAAVFAVVHRFYKFDPVSIVERRIA
jgi:ABC-type antimicrobial peptide transport system permease subunit